MKIGLLCGGPSLERGISLNSARSVMDHLQDDNIEIEPIYFDHKKRAYKISRAQLYSNTPSDFDFKLAANSRSLSEEELASVLKKVDIVFPVMHGSFGEDGEIQLILEGLKIPYIGTSSAVCKKVFDKFRANEAIKEMGFHALPSVVLKIFKGDHEKVVSEFFDKYRIKRAIVKPASGGSSIGVFSVSTAREALEKAELLFSKRMDTRVVVEPFAQGREFTVIILQNKFGLPVGLIPTEIETDYTEHQIFDFRRKYLPTRQVRYHCPPRFSNEIIERIQVQAEQLFAGFGMRDFARFDGWVLDDGNIWFSDFNPISGMEQNSFLFQQSSRVGLSHNELLRYMVRTACLRHGIEFPDHPEVVESDKRPVNVLFGGATSEKQVSLMSGTNVWLKLRKSKQYAPEPYLLDEKRQVWHLPYALTLNHTVEEIVENCENFLDREKRLSYLEKRAQMRLFLEADVKKVELFQPVKMWLEEFLGKSEYVFNALHGGMGENGVLQALMEKNGVKYNGPDSRVSRLCADKYLTNKVIERLRIPGVKVPKNKIYKISDFGEGFDYGEAWKELRCLLGSKFVIVKPRNDGCSSGVVKLSNEGDLRRYVEIVKSGELCIRKGVFSGQIEEIEMPKEKYEDLMFEEYVETDSIRIKNGKLKHRTVSGWFEVTVGVVGEKDDICVFNPSLTVADGEVLSVEEKFQGGTGVNITLPPESLVCGRALRGAKNLIKKTAEGLGISGYSRIDAFMHLERGDLIIIEVNTLPGLTPSTVFYHQALAEKKPVYPREILEKIVELSGY